MVTFLIIIIHKGTGRRSVRCQSSWTGKPCFTATSGTGLWTSTAALGVLAGRKHPPSLMLPTAPAHMLELSSTNDLQTCLPL